MSALSHKSWRIPHIIAALSGLCALGLILMPTPAGVDPQALFGGALVLLSIALYATGVLPEAITALIFFALAMLLTVASPGAVFAGFSSAALWLVFAGLIIGVAVDRTGLGARLADAVVHRFGGSYARLVAGVIMVGIGLCDAINYGTGHVINPHRTGAGRPFGLCTR